MSESDLKSIMFIIDTTLVLQLVLSEKSCLPDHGVISRIMACIEHLVMEVVEPGDVVLAVEGVGPADVLERRRRAAYAHAYCYAGRPDWDVSKALPGTAFMSSLLESFHSKGWTVLSGGGSCLVTIAREMKRAKTGLTLFARERDAEALAALCSSTLYMVWEDGYRRDYDIVDECADGVDGADAVVLDILTGGGSGGEREGGLVQDLPGLPRMPGTFAASALQRAYDAWRGGPDSLRRLTRAHQDSTSGFILNRTALVEVLTRYTEAQGGENDDRTALAEWSGAGWRNAHSQAHFPHGFDCASTQYLDAIDRELCHLSGGSFEENSASVYVHGCAPSALDIINTETTKPACPTEHVHVRGCDRALVSTWSAEMQLAAVLPRRMDKSSTDAIATALHTRLDMGCVHMFPVLYRVWWGVYPVIPLIDFELFEAGYRKVTRLVEV